MVGDAREDAVVWMCIGRLRFCSLLCRSITSDILDRRFICICYCLLISKIKTVALIFSNCLECCVTGFGNIH